MISILWNLSSWLLMNRERPIQYTCYWMKLMNYKFRTGLHKHYLNLCEINLHLRFSWDFKVRFVQPSPGHRRMGHRKTVDTEYTYYSWCMTSTDIVKWRKNEWLWKFWKKGGGVVEKRGGGGNEIHAPCACDFVYPHHEQ